MGGGRSTAERLHESAASSSAILAADMQSPRVLLPSVLFSVLSLGACRSASGAPGAPGPAEIAGLEVEVREALAAIPGDLAREGPLGWLRHFEEGPDFAMASDGELKFATFGQARAAMEAFDPTIERMELAWSDPQVVVLASNLAGFDAGYDELLVDTSGAEIRFAGYVSGVLRRGEAGWRIVRLHWSMEVP